MDPFVGEIRPMGFNFAPVGWAFCQGQIIAISQNTALFSLLGTTYGGNGTTNFALPNLAGRVPMSSGQGPGLSSYDLGEVSGGMTVTLIGTELPVHQHGISASSAAATGFTPAGKSPAKGARKPYAASPNGELNVDSVIPVGGGQPHNNMQPYLCINYLIALQGIFPQRP